MAQFVTIRKEKKIAKITIDRPDALNALNSEVLSQLKKAMEEVKRDEDVSVVIITGSGEKAFVAGADIKGMLGKKPLEMRNFTILGHEAMNSIAKIEKPVIAAVNGYALGGGLELALACDIRIASENAKLGVPEVKLGIFPGFGGTQRLTKIVGKGRAAELVFTGKMIDAKEAEQWGLVNKVVPLDDLEKEVNELAQTIAKNGPVGVRLAKSAINRALETGLNEGLAYERELVSLTFSTDDKEEGMKAFLEKRDPKFEGK
ncbi:MAG: enoyl-CoA hydratase/isomerase family protein [Thermoplasmata archaeon]